MAHPNPYPGYPHYPPQQHGAYPPPVYGVPGAPAYPPHYPPQPYGHQTYPQYPYQYPHQHPAHQHPHPPVAAAAAPHVVPQPSPVINPSDNASQTYVEQWCPNYADTNQIDQWFKEIDKESKSIVGGLDIAKFMQRSNLPRDTLRSIWALVDNPSKGYINRVQFTTIIRLVSIACSPIYMGSAPSMDRYYSTIRQNIPLPAGLFTPTEAELAANAAAAAAAAATAAAQAAPAPVVAPVVAPVAAPQPAAYGYAAAAPVAHPTVGVSHDDDMEFSDFSAAPPSPVKAAVPPPSFHAAPPAVGVEDDDDFGDFGSASAPAAAPAAAPVVAPSVDPYSSGYGDAYGYGGYGVEETHSPPASSSADAPVVVDDDDDFLGDFKSAPAQSSSSVGAIDDAFGSMNSAPAATTSSTQVSSDPPSLVKTASADSFNLSSGPNSAQPMIMRANSSHLSNNNLTVMSTTAADTGASKMSAFDDLAENDLQAAAEDWDEFEEADPNAPAPIIASAPVVAATAPKELDLLDVNQQTEVTPLPSVSSSMAPSTSFATFGDNDDFGDDFGGFESAEFTPAGPTPVPAPAATSVPPTQSLNIKTNTADAFGDFGNHDDDEFGDFDTHTPTTVNSTAPIVSQTHSIGTFTPPPIHSLQAVPTSTPTLTPVRPLPAAVAPRPAPAPAVVDDLLDFLSEPVTIVSAGSSGAVSMLPLDSHDLFNAPAAADFDPFGDNSTSSSKHDDFDPFGDSKPAKAPKAIKSPEPVVKSAEPKARGKPLSVTDLETLSLKLTEKHLYEEAYGCVQQTHILRKLSDLSEQKREAMENDELELAVQLKKDMALLSQQVDSPEEEAKWVKASQSNRVGDTIHETYDLVNSLNQSLGSKFKTRFLSKIPGSSVNLENRLEYFILARRYARMVIAICSTHTEYPAQWLKMLSCINSKVVQGKENVAKHKALKAADQQSVKSHPKFTDYFTSLVQIAELGMWLATSCEECFQHEKESKSVFASCQELLTLVHQAVNMKSKLLNGSSAELSISAAKVSERNGVTYCNLTLRPLSITGQDGSVTALYAHKTEVKGTNFMQPAINLWLKEVSPKLPKSECNFA